MRVSANALGGSALLLAVACGGPAFTERPTNPDAAASDARTNDGKPSDGPEVDAPEPDATGADVSKADAEGDGTAGFDDAADVGIVDGGEPPPPHCSGSYACAPGVPAGWTGPLELYAGPRPPASCGPHFLGPSYMGSADLVAPIPTCGCQCGAPTGVSCSAPAVSFYPGAGPTCSGPKPACATLDLVSGVCTRVDTSANCISPVSGVTMSSPGSTASGGSCAPLATSAVPVAGWGTSARACVSAAVTAQADCGAGNLCAPIPNPQYGASLCVSHGGDVTCPTAGYTTRQLYYGGIDDTRACSPCSCGGVTGTTCAANFDVFTSNSMGGCAASKVTYQTPFSCSPVQQPASFLLTLTPSVGSCRPSVSTPTGVASPVRPTTVCCL
ncbi:MAG: hypothetical protein M3O36_12630 [Myxococcota bacterium]|nr:hypothetical protein [Myxococcota bacterium]